MSDEMRNARMSVFWKLHEGRLCLSPGSDASTRRAFELVPGLPATPRVLDLGCGRGRQTLALARLTDGAITAVDLLPPFIEDLRSRAEAEGLATRIDAVVASMLEVGSNAPGYDLIWCEGAIYNVGFEAGLRTWRSWLAPGGCLVVSEATWLTSNPPAVASDLWGQEYPPMQLHEENVSCVEKCGLELIGSFVLPDSDWLDEYYDPIVERIAALRIGESDPAVLAALDAEEAEATLYQKSEGAYGYVFYVMRAAG